MKDKPIINVQVWGDGTVHFVREFNHDYIIAHFNNPTKESITRIADLTFKFRMYKTRMLANRAVMIIPLDREGY